MDTKRKADNKCIIYIIAIAALLIVSVPLLRSDSAAFLRWYLVIFLLGVGYYPLSRLMFSGMEDRGWMFSKVIGIALAGFLAFALITPGLLPFSTPVCIVTAAIGAALCWTVWFIRKARSGGKEDGRSGAEDTVSPDIILLEELLFLAVFLMWTYFVCFRPEAYGQEKFMDYGFMASMMRSDTLPAKDIWYGLKNINYYYGGQYYAVYLTRLSFTQTAVSYNLMRMTVASFAFVLPFSIVFQLLRDRLRGRRHSKLLSSVGGAGAGFAVSLAGNMHYVLYGLFGSVFKLSGYDSYWFPSSTRYIGHNPETTDMCIHEYPCYSIIEGDLHAHMVNIMFVLTVTGLLFSMLRKERKKSAEFNLKEILLNPNVILCGFFIGLFQFTNFWDFVIYFTVASVTVIVITLKYSRCGVLKGLLRILLQVFEMIAVGMLAALPFNATFERVAAQGIGIAKNHSALYQLAILWGLPVVCTILLLVFVLVRARRARKLRPDTEKGFRNNPFIRFFRSMDPSDCFALIMGICAIGLILIPELVYVRDIYEENNARANTMFKLTYQAFILFGMTMIYALMRFFTLRFRSVLTAVLRVIAALLAFLFILTCGYFWYSVQCWFGDVADQSRFQGLDCTAFLETRYPSDAAAVRWLNENVEGSPIVLETNGYSYSEDCRVSAMTGLPTVLGWYTHEHLWRNDTDDINAIWQDIRKIYTANDARELETLLKKYDISYIFIGSREHEAYKEMNLPMLISMGDVVFSDRDRDTYIIKVY